MALHGGLHLVALGGVEFDHEFAGVCQGLGDDEVERKEVRPADVYRAEKIGGLPVPADFVKQSPAGCRLELLQDIG